MLIAGGRIIGIPNSCAAWCTLLQDHNLVTEAQSPHPTDWTGEPALRPCASPAGISQTSSTDPATSHCQAGGEVSYTSLGFSTAGKMMFRETEMKEYLRWASAHPSWLVQHRHLANWLPDFILHCSLSCFLLTQILCCMYNLYISIMYVQMLMYKLYICCHGWFSRILLIMATGISWVIFCMAAMHRNTLKEICGPNRWAALWRSGRWCNSQGWSTQASRACLEACVFNTVVPF